VVRRVSALDLVAGTALVTGGGSGLGRAIARALAEGGAPVALVDLLADGAAETAQQITKAGGRATVIPADVRSSFNTRLQALVTQG